MGKIYETNSQIFGFEKRSEANLVSFGSQPKNGIKSQVISL